MSTTPTFSDISDPRTPPQVESPDPSVHYFSDPPSVDSRHDEEDYGAERPVSSLHYFSDPPSVGSSIGDIRRSVSHESVDILDDSLMSFENDRSPSIRSRQSGRIFITIPPLPVTPASYFSDLMRNGSPINIMEVDNPPMQRAFSMESVDLFGDCVPLYPSYHSESIDLVAESGHSSFETTAQPAPENPPVQRAISHESIDLFDESEAVYENLSHHASLCSIDLPPMPLPSRYNSLRRTVSTPVFSDISDPSTHTEVSFLL